MPYTLYTHRLAAKPQTHLSGLAVRTGLRGGLCVDINDQVKDALQTLTNALAGTTTATTAATPATTSPPATA